MCCTHKTPASIQQLHSTFPLSCLLISLSHHIPPLTISPPPLQVIDTLLPIVLGMARTDRLPHAVHEMGQVAAVQLKEMIRQLLEHVLAQDHGGEGGGGAAEQLQMLPVCEWGVGGGGGEGWSGGDENVYGVVKGGKVVF